MSKNSLKKLLDVLTLIYLTTFKWIKLKTSPTKNKKKKQKMTKITPKIQNCPHFFRPKKDKTSPKKYKNGPTVFPLKNTKIPPNNTKKTPNNTKKTPNITKGPKK